MIKELSKPQPGSKDLYFPTRYSQSLLNQCMACLWKQHWSYWRNPQYSAVRLLFTIFTALTLGTIFWGLGSKRYLLEVKCYRFNFYLLFVLNKIIFCGLAGDGNKTSSML
jgi:hypothetical protein